MAIFATALRMKRLASVSNPPAGTDALYFKGNGLPYIKNPEGLERPLLLPDVAMHANPSWEVGGTAPGTGWNTFWSSGGTFSFDTSDFVEGTRSLKVVWASGAGTHLQVVDAIPVTPGSIIEESVWNKASIAGNINVILYTAPTAADAAVLAPNNAQQIKSFAMGTAWSRAAAQFTIPAGHNFARVAYTSDAGREVRLDNGGSRVLYSPPGSINELAMYREVANAMTYTNQTSWAVMSNATERTQMTKTLVKRQASSKLIIAASANVGLASGIAQQAHLGLRIGGVDYGVGRAILGGTPYMSIVGVGREITGLAEGSYTIEPIVKMETTSSMIVGAYSTVSYTVREV